jgi:sugar/nucleoside kinase (ribokinase family)
MDVVTVGWLTRDDIVLTDGAVHRDVVGGGALYSAVGAAIWAPRVGIHAVTGAPFLDEVRAAIGDRGIDTAGIGAIAGNGLQLWLLHESEADKQQLPKLGSSTADDMDRGRGPLPDAYAGARGFHIAPQTPAGSLDTARWLGSLPGRPVVTLDLLSDEFIDRRLYADLAFLDGVTAFLPSEAEVERIWHPSDLLAWMRKTALLHGCHIVVKKGAEGSLVCDAHSGHITRVPAYPAVVIDTTGAGDAYCGGFLAGLVAARDLVTCAAMGTVSASYVIEACGALDTTQPDAADREARLSPVLKGAGSA